MKKVEASILLIVVLFVFFSPHAFSEPQQQSKISAIAGISWDFSLYAGLEWRFSKSYDLSLRNLIGTSLLLPVFISDESFILSGETTIIYIPDYGQRRLFWGVSAGASNISGVWYRDEDTEQRAFEAVLSLGINAMAGWRFKSGHKLRIWLGGGYPFFYDRGWETRNISFPLNLWPNLKIDLSL